MRASITVIGDNPVNSLHRYACAVRNLPAMENAAIGNGSFSVVSETHKVIRRVPLLAALNGQIFPSLIAETLHVALRADTIDIRSKAAAQGMGGPASVNATKGRTRRCTSGARWLDPGHYTGRTPV